MGTTKLQTKDFKEARREFNEELDRRRDELISHKPEQIHSFDDGRAFIERLREYREAIAEVDKHNGENYPKLLDSILAVGGDGIYSNKLRFIYELIQNVDDCDYPVGVEPELNIRFDFNKSQIIFTYNEIGFTPFNVFAITGIAEAAKNISDYKNEIGEKGIGFKSVFGIAEKVLIRSGWFSFELHKERFTIPVFVDERRDYCAGTEMTLYVSAGKAKEVYSQLKGLYCGKEALFSGNPLLFLNKLSKLKMYYDSWRSMEFYVSRSRSCLEEEIYREDDVCISIDLHDYENGSELSEKKEIHCTRYTYPVNYSREACQSRYGADTKLGAEGGRRMLLQAVIPHRRFLESVGRGALYSFLPTQLHFTVPVICHAPFKLDASREFVDPQGENLWFTQSCEHLSRLLDHAYLDWRKTAGNGIISYIPGRNESLFVRNNGKELCLSRQECFKGSHFLSLPLFYTVNNCYRSASEILCFDHNERIDDPEAVYLLLGCKKELFIPPEKTGVSKFGIDVERDVSQKLFAMAMRRAEITSDALRYLDSAEFRYENAINKLDAISVTTAQLEEIMRHENMASALMKVALGCIERGGRASFTICHEEPRKIRQLFSDVCNIDDAPRKVRQYLKYCEENSLLLDIEETQFLPCRNALVLSQNNSFASFGAFCLAVDPKDSFSIRVKLREASAKLNQYDVAAGVAATEYLRELRNVRLMVKESLGYEGYRSYIDLILKSGADRGRFLQELIQNADDCKYPDGVTPSFALSLKNGTIVTEYNEYGFTRANVRAITAIGESTKNKLLSGDLRAIGEKGVGFKSVFAVASEVRIISGEFCFSLTAKEPTIPQAFKPPATEAKGTKMEIKLKDAKSIQRPNTAAILELCLCLRNLRELDINGHKVSIRDEGGTRRIIIDKRIHSFTRFEHPFTVDDPRALEERKSGTREVSAEQSVVCYVPHEKERTEFPLYSGLPTKHRVRIPLVIDAPFMLTTSREEIELGSEAWNGFVRKEMYAAIIEVMEALKESQRAEILRFLRVVPRRHGERQVYANDMFDCNYLKNYDFTGALQAHRILPTFDEKVFVSPRSKRALRYPEVVNWLFSRSAFDVITPSGAIDTDGEDYGLALNALGYETLGYDRALPIIGKYASEYVEEASFREVLYKYLVAAPPEYKEFVRRLAIIPVYETAAGTVKFVFWNDETIFVKRNALVSPESYFVLNETLLPKADCERIFGKNINEMNAQWERNCYNDALKKTLRGSDVCAIYRYLVAEHKKGSFMRYESLGILLEHRDFIPLKNQLGEITDTELYACNMPAGYFPVEMLQRIIVHEECAQLAGYLNCAELSGIHYEDLKYCSELTAEDLESLRDDYFSHGDEILRGFYNDGLLSDALLSEYELNYLSMGGLEEGEDEYEFPDEPLTNRASLKEYVKRLWQNPIRIIKVSVERTVDKGQDTSGRSFELGINEARDQTIQTYTPEGARKKCFCQMCRKVKNYEFIEVNCIEKEPRYFFRQLRIALCLECSKRFESFRGNAAILEAFLNAVSQAAVTTGGHVDIPLSKDFSIRFTAKHLAEIQEILKRMPEKDAALASSQ